MKIIRITVGEEPTTDCYTVGVGNIVSIAEDKKVTKWSEGHAIESSLVYVITHSNGGTTTLSGGHKLFIEREPENI